jgi:hypothetical protein
MLLSSLASLFHATRSTTDLLGSAAGGGRVCWGEDVFIGVMLAVGVSVMALSAYLVGWSLSVPCHRHDVAALLVSAVGGFHNG